MLLASEAEPQAMSLSHCRTAGSTRYLNLAPGFCKTSPEPLQSRCRITRSLYAEGENSVSDSSHRRR